MSKKYHIFYGWVVAISCSLLAFSINAMGNNSLSFYVAPLSESLQISRAALNFFLFTVGAIVRTVLGFFYGIIVKRIGTKTLMCADLTSSGLQNVIGVAENVETAAFLGHGKTLAYYYDYVSGIGALGIYQGRDAQLLSESASGVYFAEDMEALYYIENADETTGNGDLLCFRNGKATVLDSNVFCLQYKNNGTLAYLKGYDYITGLGDLSYYNGKEAVAVDSGVTALFLD